MEQSSKRYYFAYGSNINYARMRGRKAKWKARVPAVLIDWQLFFNTKSSKGNWAVANICKKQGGRVEGIVYETDEQSLQKIDKYEGVPDHYRRERVVVELQDGKKLECVTYVAKPLHKELPTKRWYLNHILTGRKSFSKEHYAYLLAAKVME